MNFSENEYCIVDISFEDDNCYFVNEESDSEFCFIEGHAVEEDFCIIEKPESLIKNFEEDFENLSYNDKEEPEDEFMIKLSIHRKELLNICKMEASNEETIEYIKAYIEDEVSDPMFIYALTISITESLMIASHDKSTLAMGKAFFNDLMAKLKIVKRFVNNDEDLGLKVILGIQQLSFENKHPEGFVEMCFNAVYEVEITHEGVFAEWEINEDPKFQLGKDACLSSASRFLNFLKDDQCYDYYLLRGF